MKRILKLSIISLLIFSFLVPYTAFAGTPQAAEKWQDIELTDEDSMNCLQTILIIQ